MIFYYCILPGGNRADFPLLDAEMVRRGVTAEFTRLKNQSRLYRVPVTKLPYLPHDEKGPYFGDESSGHAVYELSDEAVKAFLSDMSPGPWEPVREAGALDAFATRPSAPT